jgi:hypothetical protein
MIISVRPARKLSKTCYCIMPLFTNQFVLSDKLKNEALNGATDSVIRNQEFNSTVRYSIQLKSPPSALVSFPFPVKIQAKNLIVIHECGRPGCAEIGKKNCSACDTENYCSTDALIVKY